MTPQRVLVTGGSGFIGGEVMRRLGAGGWVALSCDFKLPTCPHAKACSRIVDILDCVSLSEAVAVFRPEVIVHLAARTDFNGRETSDYAANIEGVRNLLIATRQCSSVKRLIVASSMLVCPPGYTPRDELDVCPTTAYGVSKVETERIIRSTPPACTWCIVRPTTIWGPGLDRLRLGLLRILRRGLYFHPSGYPCKRTYGYVGNTVDQLLALINADPVRVHGQTFYLGDDPIDLHAYVDGFSRALTGRPVRTVPHALLRILARTGDFLQRVGIKAYPLTSYRLSNMSADNVLDVGPIQAIAGPSRWSLAEGIRETVDWVHAVESKSLVLEPG